MPCFCWKSFSALIVLPTTPPRVCTSCSHGTGRRSLQQSLPDVTRYPDRGLSGLVRLWCKWPSRANAPLYAVQTSSPKHRVPDCRRSSALNGQTPQSELSLADAMHQLDAGDRDRGIPEPLEDGHPSNALLPAPMGLLSQIVQCVLHAERRCIR